MYNSATIREQIAQKEWSELLLYLCRPYTCLGFFIKGYHIYPNSKILGYINSNANYLKRCNTIKFLKGRGSVLERDLPINLYFL